MQAGHACLAAGSRFGPPAEACNLVLLGVANERQLFEALERIQAAGIRCAVFHEPDDGIGYSAACTEPLAGSRRRVFRRFSLWDDGHLPLRARPPPGANLKPPAFYPGFRRIRYA